MHCTCCPCSLQEQHAVKARSGALSCSLPCRRCQYPAVCSPQLRRCRLLGARPGTALFCRPVQTALCMPLARHCSSCRGSSRQRQAHTPQLQRSVVHPLSSQQACRHQQWSFSPRLGSILLRLHRFLWQVSHWQVVHEQCAQGLCRCGAAKHLLTLGIDAPLCAWQPDVHAPAALQCFWSSTASL